MPSNIDDIIISCQHLIHESLPNSESHEAHRESLHDPKSEQAHLDVAVLVLHASIHGVVVARKG